MYKGVDSQLALLTQIEGLSKQLVSSSRVQANVIRPGPYDVIYVVEVTSLVIVYHTLKKHIIHETIKSQTVTSTHITHDTMIIQILIGLIIKFKISTRKLLKIHHQGSHPF